jgi:ABC-type transporter Mla subunit MlaD
LRRTAVKVHMPADSTIQNALIVIAIAVSLQTLLRLCAVVAITVAWKRAMERLDSHVNRFSQRLDDVAAQTRAAVDALERSSTQVNEVMHDAGNVLRTVNSVVGAPRALLLSGAAQAASAFSRWRRSRRQQHDPAAAR